jgi:hypothetical protein
VAKKIKAKEVKLMRAVLIALSLLLVTSNIGLAKGAPDKKAPAQHQENRKPAPAQSSDELQVPNSVANISKENTYPNPAQSEPELKPSPLAEELTNSSNVDIENPTLIRLLNETDIHTTKWAIGYHARIYLGKWALNYESEKTTVNWEYKPVNENILDNRGGKSFQKMTYTQEKQEKVEGGLTSNIEDEKEVQKLMMMKASQKTALPLGFKTYVGRGTKIERVYNVEPKKVGHLRGYVPAVNEKGKVTFGEVYLVLKGGHKKLEVKNITQHGIGAWIPIQDHVALRYHVSN